MEELTTEILEIDEREVPYQAKRRGSSYRRHSMLQGTLKSDFRIYSTKISYFYSSFFSLRRELYFKKSRLSKW